MLFHFLNKINHRYCCSIIIFKLKKSIKIVFRLRFVSHFLISFLFYFLGRGEEAGKVGQRVHSVIENEQWHHKSQIIKLRKIKTKFNIEKLLIGIIGNLTKIKSSWRKGKFYFELLFSINEFRINIWHPIPSPINLVRKIGFWWLTT